MTRPRPEAAETASNDAATKWTGSRSISYPRVAAMALPPFVIVTAFLGYRELERVAHDPPLTASEGMRTEPSRVPPSPSLTSSAAAHAFDEIYRAGHWGANDAGVGTSGSGSTMAATLHYRAYLQEFLKTHRIRSVVDVGCGDWEFSQAIDWSGIDYKGYDIVEAVIARDKAKYEAPNIHFFTANAITDELPVADLIIAKHVLQHLPNADVAQFSTKLGHYRHALLTNSVHPMSLTGDNRDISVGDFRFFDPTQPPLRLRGAKELTWWDGRHMHQVVHLVHASDPADGGRPE